MGAGHCRLKIAPSVLQTIPVVGWGRDRKASVAPGGGNRCAGFIKDRRHSINGDDTDSTEDLTDS